MDVVSNVTTIVAAFSGVVAALAAARNWWLQGIERRITELRRLQASLEKSLPYFNELFDYLGAHDHSLRVRDLQFSEAEVQHRMDADRAFEHLRDVANSFRMRLLKKEDLGPWIYWIHTVSRRGREPLQKYSRACGYESFMKTLREATQDSEELRLLKTECTWW